VALTLLNPAFMSVTRQADGSLLYRYTGYPQGEVKGQRDYTEDEIFHVRGFGIGGDLGLSPISYARQSLSAHRATERAAATTFANGMRPSGWLVYKGGTLTDAQREQARTNLIEPMSGAENSGKTGILEADFDYRQMTIPPEAAQLLETRAFGVEEVCRVHGVPPVLVGHASAGQTMWGSGIEQIVIGWHTLGLRPYLTRIEQAVKRSLIPAADKGVVYAEFSIEGLLRGDHASRGEFYWKLVQVGAMTPNQICDLENMPRFEGGDVHLVNTTLAPLDMAGKAPAPASAASPEPAGAPPLRVVK
jgi:HK97 family phage portal protein